MEDMQLHQPFISSSLSILLNQRLSGPLMVSLSVPDHVQGQGPAAQPQKAWGLQQPGAGDVETEGPVVTVKIPSEKEGN